MLNNATAPISGFTGGVIPSFCPMMPSAADLDKPGVAGTSDAIKKDALEAKMRREKVRFLGTVDCRYYPDAVAALTAALRTDGSECVRFEAALALGHGCCCNQKTLDALDASVAGTDKDGNPAERSVRVRCAAAIALERCLACYVPPPIEIEEIKKDNVEIAPPPGEVPLKKLSDANPSAAKPATPTITPTAAKKPTTESRPPSRQSVEAARQMLSEFNAMLAATRPQAMVTTMPGADHASVYQIIKNSAGNPNQSAIQQVSATMPVQPSAPAGPTIAVGRPISPAATELQFPSISVFAPSEPERFPRTTASAPAPMTPAPTPPPPLAPPVTAPVAPAVSVATQPVSAVAPNPVVPILAQVLKGATPADRHAAIRQLVRFDWHDNPVVVSGLLAGAKNDPASAVRVDCLRHLAGYQMTHPQVLADLEMLTHDSDQWVRDEATKALAQLKSNP